MIISLCNQHDHYRTVPVELIRVWIRDCEECTVILDND